MENNTNLKRVSALLIAATIIALIVHLVGLDIFNKRVITVHDNDSNSASYMEIDARKDSTKIGVIFYYRDTLDLSDYDLEFQYHRTFTQGPTFLVFALLAALAFIFVLMAAVSSFTYKRAQTVQRKIVLGMADMVMILLDGVEEDHFVKTAFNVARYHHERWDGKGYPDGLVGETIPLEARIMAVADVYDALVSERVYKKPYSFERAYEIMCEGMGTQFDPNMRAVFIGCRDKLEQYYSSTR